MEQPKKDAQKELEIALNELEERVDRLRNLYEQYFIGFEKVEPGVQRRDVDRRFAALRKTQIRNTAQRYRFNVITQKFNTYSMYWTRVCRQIEEGTFKRHVAKAARRFASVSSTRDVDDSVEVELGELEDVEDLDAILGEANALGGGDPNAANGLPDRGAESRRQKELAPEPPGSTSTGAPSAEASRAQRQAALPPGAKPRVLIRRRVPGSAEMPSTSVPNADAKVAPRQGTFADADSSSHPAATPAAPATTPAAAQPPFVPARERHDPAPAAARATTGRFLTSAGVGGRVVRPVVRPGAAGPGDHRMGLPAAGRGAEVPARPGQGQPPSTEHARAASPPGRVASEESPRAQPAAPSEPARSSRRPPPLPSHLKKQGS